MTTENQLLQKNAALEQELKSLREENEILTDKAEDFLLLGIISEKIGLAKSKDEVIDITLDSVSSLKDIYYAAFMGYRDNDVEIIRDYAPFSSINNEGKSFQLTDDIHEALKNDEFIITCGEESRVPSFIPDKVHGKNPKAIFIISVELPGEDDSSYAFLFVSYIHDNYNLQVILPLLRRAIEIVSVKIESITFSHELEILNNVLESKVKNRTARLTIEIDERKRAQEELSLSFERFKTVLDGIDELIYVADMENYELLFVNKYGRDIFGENLIGRVCWQTLQFGQDGPCPFGTNARLLDANGNATGTYVWQFQNTVTNSWFECHDQAIQWTDNRLVRLGIATDITQNKLSAIALAGEKERLEAITENIPGVVFQFYVPNTGEPGVRYASSKLLDIFGLEFIDDHPTLLQKFIGNIHEEDRQSFIDSVQEASEKQILWRWSGRYVKPSGEIIWFEGHSSPIARQDELVFNGILFDITSTKKLEEEYERAEKQLRRGQKMEAIGLMAGGVAHDLNNILSSIISYPDLLLLDLPHDSPLRKPIETIQSSGLRAAAVVADLLTVARGAAAAKEVCDLNKLLLEYLESPELNRPLEDHPEITLHTNFAPDILTLNCSAIHIRKCLLNLFVNACEAIGNVGKVTISTCNRYIDQPLKGYDEVRGGEYVVLSVADTGSGIATEDIDHIFDPFYSKKIMGRSGTGLGLAVVWSAVQDHNGYIDISTNDQGTCFELYFPASRELVGDGKEQITAQDLLGRGQTVLVVDDEVTQRDIATSLLTRLGYQPTSVASGEEAVDFLKTHKVDLLVLDMIMNPGMNGRKTYAQIISLYPGQKAVIASGFSETDEVKKAQSLGAGTFIKKPYTLNQLGKAVKRELET